MKLHWSWFYSNFLLFHFLLMFIILAVHHTLFSLLLRLAIILQVIFRLF
jgi:hypothetical protein